MVFRSGTAFSHAATTTPPLTPLEAVHARRVYALSTLLGGVTVLSKGSVDVIASSTSGVDERHCAEGSSGVFSCVRVQQCFVCTSPTASNYSSNVLSRFNLCFPMSTSGSSVRVGWCWQPAPLRRVGRHLVRHRRRRAALGHAGTCRVTIFVVLSSC